MTERKRNECLMNTLREQNHLMNTLREEVWLMTQIMGHINKEIKHITGQVDRLGSLLENTPRERNPIHLVKIEDESPYIDEDISDLHILLMALKQNKSLFSV
tara:strand:- start:3 stop:308 length:306 start_codon:yes stop_codon:yes gene_type:complete